MKPMIYLLVLALACLPVLAQEAPKTLEALRAELASGEGVKVAIIQTDENGETIKVPRVNVGGVPMKGTEGYEIALITYIHESGNVSHDNTVAVALDPDGNATWKDRVPSVIAPRQEAPKTAGLEDDIVAAIETSQNVKLLKWSIQHDSGGADVDAAIEVDGKIISVRYRAYQDREAWVIKPYDDAATKEAVTR